MDDIEKLLSQCNKDDDLDKIKAACAELRLRFDTVHIFTTRHSDDDGGTINCNWGSGNWFSRYGQVREWMIFNENDMRSKGDDKDI